MKNTILLVHRAHRFSPNCVERDAAVLYAIQQAFEAQNFIVKHVDEEAITEEYLRSASQFIISMARSKEALQKLSEWEQQEGNTIWNSAKAVLVNSRAEQTRRFVLANISIPPTEISDSPHSTSLNFPLWVKSGGGDAEKATDVRYFSCKQELLDATFFEQSAYVLSEHVEGDLVKFYGVAGTSFFYAYYPTNFSKFGLETHNGAPRGFAFDRAALQQLANQAAALCGFTLYGGDCIVRSDGTFALIDFNDFPSFAPCAHEAAAAITEVVEKVLS